MPFSQGNPGRPKGSKNKATLDKEARRAIFDEQVSEKFLRLIDRAKPEYLLDQFIGKAKESHDLKVTFLFEDTKTES